MKKFILKAKTFNALKRDPNGPKSQRIWFDNFKGMGADLGKTKKSIIYKFKSPVTNKFRILTIESYSYDQSIGNEQIMDLEEDYLTQRKKIRAGVDPLAEKDTIKKERKEAEEAVSLAKIEAEKPIYTLEDAFNDYTKHRIFTDDIAPATQDMYIGCFSRNIYPAMGKMPLVDLEVGDIEDYLDKQKDSVCNVSIALLMRVQKVAMRGKQKKITKPFIFGQERRRITKRKTIVKDIPAFLEFLHNNEQYTSYHNALHTQLLYGTRGNEAYGIKWEEVDFEEGVINISWERVKTRRIALKQFDPLVIPILPRMAEILEQQKGFSEVFVFPMLRKDKAVTNSIIYPFIKSHGFDFSSHDVRRTVSQTLRTFEGVSMDDIDIVLDHAISAVNQSYVSGTPLERKRKILMKWHTYLDSLINTDVTHLKAVN